MLNVIFTGLTAVFVISIIIFLVERLKGCSVKATVLKATSSLLFVVLACVAVLIKPENSGYGMMFIIGMVLCTVGDIWLDLKYVHKEYDEQYTFVGIGSFMISHVFYLAGILLAYPEFIGWQVALAIFSALSVSVIERLVSKKTGFEYGKFKTLTFVYSVVIMLTVTFALNAVNAFGWLPVLGGAEMPAVMPRFLCMNMGTVIFALSDLSLSIAFFRKGGNTKLNVVVIHVTYYLAQFLLALSILM
jgi:uncharacterized membrane protein YhhN